MFGKIITTPLVDPTVTIRQSGTPLADPEFARVFDAMDRKRPLPDLPQPEVFGAPVEEENSTKDETSPDTVETQGVNPPSKNEELEVALRGAEAEDAAGIQGQTAAERAQTGISQLSGRLAVQPKVFFVRDHGVSAKANGTGDLRLSVGAERVAQRTFVGPQSAVGSLAQMQTDVSRSNIESPASRDVEKDATEWVRTSALGHPSGIASLPDRSASTDMPESSGKASILPQSNPDRIEDFMRPKMDTESRGITMTRDGHSGKDSAALTGNVSRDFILGTGSMNKALADPAASAVIPEPTKQMRPDATMPTSADGPGHLAVNSHKAAVPVQSPASNDSVLPERIQASATGARPQAQNDLSEAETSNRRSTGGTVGAIPQQDPMPADVNHLGSQTRRPIVSAMAQPPKPLAAEVFVHGEWVPNHENRGSAVRNTEIPAPAYPASIDPPTSLGMHGTRKNSDPSQSPAPPGAVNPPEVAASFSAPTQKAAAAEASSNVEVAHEGVSKIASQPQRTDAIGSRPVQSGKTASAVPVYGSIMAAKHEAIVESSRQGAEDVSALGGTISDNRPGSPLPSLSGLFSGPRSDHGPVVIRQMVEVAGQLQDGPIELRLNPEELGRVRMQMVTSDQSVMMHITSERPETLDILRRHIDQLHRELTGLGFSRVDFTFSQQGQGNPSGSARTQARNERNAPDLSAVSSAALIPPTGPDHNDGLDIRL